MPKNFKNFLQVFLILLLKVSSIISISTLETCSVGMRTTFIDNRNVNVFGTARKIPLSISFFEDLGGAVWLNREVRIEPRFEVHLKVMVNDLAQDQPALQNLHGFTIILSKNKDYLAGTAGNTGYDGLTQSYVAEIDAEESKFIFHRCFTESCSSTQTGGRSGVFYPIYKYNENFQFDIRFSYDHEQRKTRICFGETYCISEDINLVSLFGDPTVYLGFTGFNKGNRRELNMLGTFICEDRFDFPKTNTYFTLNGVQLAENKATVGESLRFVYSPKNIYSVKVPFYDDLQKMNIKITPSTCKISLYGETPVYEKWFDFKCDEVGNGEICLYEKDENVCEHSTQFKLISSKPAYCNPIGHDGRAFQEGEKIWNPTEGKFELRYEGKYFYLAESSDITFDVKFTDNFGNEADFGTSESAELIELSLAQVKGSGCSMIMSRVDDYYRLTITKQSTGRCTITIPTMEYDYYFNMIAGPPSPIKSSCTIAGQTGTPIFQPGDTFTYQCTLNDAFGNPVEASKLQEYYDTTYTIEVQKSEPAGEPGTIECQNGQIDGPSFTLNCNTGAMGTYTINVKLQDQPINAIVSTVNVQGMPTDFNEYTQYYYPSSGIWTTSTTTTYKQDASGLLLLIDFTDGSSSTLISKYKYSDLFRPENDIQCSLTYPHDTSHAISLISPSAEYYVNNGKTYVAIKYPESTDIFIKKTSYHYELNCHFKNKQTTTTFTINYPVNLGSYSTCLHPLDVEKTTLNFPYTTPLTAGDNGIVGTVISRTTDGHLYNYLTDLEITISPDEEGNAIKITPGEYQGIHTYDLKFKKAGEYSISFKLENENFATKTIEVKPSIAAEILLPEGSPYRSENGVYVRDRVSTDENIRTEFLVKDEFGNLIDFGKDVGITLSLSIDGKIVKQDVQIKSSNFENGKYFYEDSSTALGEYTLQLRVNSNSQTYTFKYQKTAGAVVSDKIEVKNQITYVLYGGIHDFEIYFYDKLGKNIADDPALYEQAIAKVQIQATTESEQQQINYTPTLTPDKSARYFSNELEFSEIVNVNVLFDSQVIFTFNYQVGYEIIDPKKSTMIAKLATEKIMKPESSVTVNTQTDSPIFRFTFQNSNGEIIKNLDPQTTFEAILDLSSENRTLTQKTKTESYIEWLSPEDFTTLLGGNYRIVVKINGEENEDLIFPITILNSGTEDAENADYVVAKTYFFSTTIEAIAGETKSFVMQLRTAIDKRCYIDGLDMVDIFDAYDEKGFLQNGNMEVSFEQGSKRGEAICYVTQLKTDENILHIKLKTYNGSDYETIPTTVTVKIHCAKFNKLTIDPTCIKQGNELQEGNVISIPTVTFTPYDIYDNIYTDLFDSSITSKEFLSSLVSSKHSNSKANLESTPGVDKQKFSLTLSTQALGTLTLTSKYFTDSYIIRVHAGPIDFTKTEVSLISESEIVAGTQEVVYRITPRDTYGNMIDYLDASYQNDFNIVANNVITGHSFTTSDITFTDPYFEFRFNITEAGTIYFNPEYQSDVISCTTCTIKVDPAEIFIANTVVYYDNTPMNTQEKVTIYNDVYPQFNVKFYDQFNNLIKDLADDISLTGSIEGEGEVFALNLRTAKDYYTLFVNMASVKGRWEYLRTSENYLLKIVAKGENLPNYPLYLVNQESGDGSNEPLDLAQTTFTPESINIYAGSQAQIIMEQKAIDGFRWNNWYDDPNSNISLSFTQDYIGCTHKIDYGDKPGRYIIDVECEKSTAQNVAIQISVDGQTIQQTIPLVVNPGKIAYTIAKNKGKDESHILDQANADNSYSFIIIAYDKYDNIANNNTKDISCSITPPESHSDAQIKPTITKNDNDLSFTVKLDPIYAGDYKVTSSQFQDGKDYEFTSIPGEIYAPNSILITPSSAIAGNQTKICIFAFDKNNNFKEADASNNPFQLTFHQPLETSEIEVTEWNISTCEYNGEQKTAYVYYQTLRKANDNTFKGLIGNDKVNCISCIVNVAPAEMYFLNSAFERFDPEKNQYVELKDGAVEDNKNSAPLYKLLPRDFYYNAIDSIDDKTGFGALITKEDSPTVNIPFKLKDNNIPSKFIEFIKDDENKPAASDPYENLVNGTYLLTFTKGAESINFHILLKGDYSDSDASNEPADLNKTQITESKLDFTAGGEGEIYIQITTANGFRKNSHDGYDFQVESCNSSDTSFNYTVEKSGTLGVYIIKVTTQQSNTLPEPISCPLTILVKNTSTEFAPVTGLNPLMTVSPKGIHHAIIEQSYIESEGKLIDGNVDTPYSFIVYTFDEYGNRNKGLQSTILISSSPRIDSANFLYNENKDGSITYTLTITKAGVYTISSNYNSMTKTYYLPREYSLTISHGQIAPLKSVIEIEKTKIEAGRTASLLISCKDKYDNEIKPNEVGDIFKVSIYDPNKQEIPATKEILENQIKYTVYLTKKGICSWSVKDQQDEDIFTKVLEVEVIPTDADPLKTVYKTGDDHKYDVNTPYSIPNTQTSVSFKAEDYDIFGNRIVDSGKMTISNAVLTGNSMEEISLVATENQALFTVEMPNSEVNETAFYTFSHLVSGTGYSFVFDVEKAAKEYTSGINDINTLDDFKNALIKDGRYRLMNNIEISSSEFIVDKKYSIQIDLNGKTITVTANSNNGLKLNGELILKNGNLVLSGSAKAIVQLYDGSKYYAYNVAHTGGESSIGIEVNAHAFIEIEGGSFTSTNLFSAEGYPENIIIMKGNVNAQACTNAFISADKNKAELRIYEGGSYGFSIENYLKTTQVTLPVTITSTKDYTGYGNGPFVAAKTEVSPDVVTFRAGDSYEIKIYFRTMENKLFNDEINPSYISFSVQDTSLSYTYQRGEVYGESIVILTSTKAVDSNVLTVTVTDKQGSSYQLFVNVNVLPALIPSAEKTVITLSPDEELTPPATTIHFGLILSDKYGNQFKNMCSELMQARFAIEEKDQVSSRITPDTCIDNGGELTFNNYVISYPPNSHTINVIYYVGNEGTKVLTNDKTFQVTVNNKVDFTKSDVKCPKCNSITAGDKLDLEVSLYDANKICFNEQYEDIPLGVRITSIGTGSTTYTYSFETAFESMDSCQNTYKMIQDTVLTKAGEYILVIYGIEGSKQITIKEYNHIVVAGEPHKDHLYVTRELTEITNPIELLVGNEFKFLVQARDQYDNPLNTQFSDKFGIRLEKNNGEEYEPTDLIKNSFDPKNDGLHYQLSFKKTGNVKMFYTFEEKDVTYIRIDGNIKTPVSGETGVYEALLIKPGACSEVNRDVDLSEVEALTDIQVPVNFTITCFDEYGNRLTEGGTEFNIEITVTKLESETSTDVKSKFIDNEDGTYNVTFNPPIEGTYTLVIKINGETIYANERVVIKVIPFCPPHGDTTGLNFECPGREPGNQECVLDSNITGCLPIEQRCDINDTSTPFRCQVDGTYRCVASFSDCDCPNGYIHCPDWYQNQCYPEDSIWECPFVLQDSCRGKSGYPALCPDGVCRLRDDLLPNKYVCPYGYYQCSDLTCVKSVAECQVYDEFQCDYDEIVCDDQTCASTNADCPTRITCTNPDYYVCPDGSCVANEMLCKPIKCYDPTPILCPSGVCASRRDLCPKGISCGHTYSLCEDNICKHDCRAS